MLPLLNILHPIQPSTQSAIGSIQRKYLGLYGFAAQIARFNSWCKWQLSKCVSLPVFSAGGRSRASTWHKLASGCRTAVLADRPTKWQFCSPPGDCIKASPTWRRGHVPSLSAAGQPESARTAIHPCLPGLSRAQFRRSGLATRAVDNIGGPTHRQTQGSQREECNEGELSGSGGSCGSESGRLLVSGMFQLYARPM